MDEEVRVHVEGPCKRCGKNTGQKCHICDSTYYCSPECQSQDWSNHLSSCLVDEIEGEGEANLLSDDEEEEGEIVTTKEKENRTNNIRIYFLFHDIYVQKITKFKMKVKTGDKISRIRHYLSSLTGIPSYQIMIAEVFNKLVYRVYVDDDDAMEIKAHETIIAYQLVSPKGSSDYHVNYQELIPGKNRCFCNFSIFCFTTSRESGYYTYYSANYDNEDRVRVTPALEIPIFIPIPFTPTSVESNIYLDLLKLTSKELYHIVLERFVQFFPTEKLKQYFGDILSLGDYSKIFPISDEEMIPSHKKRSSKTESEVEGEQMKDTYFDSNEKIILFRIYLDNEFQTYHSFNYFSLQLKELVYLKYDNETVSEKIQNSYLNDTESSKVGNGFYSRLMNHTINKRKCPFFVVHMDPRLIEIMGIQDGKPVYYGTYYQKVLVEEEIWGEEYYMKHKKSHQDEDERERVEFLRDSDHFEELRGSIAPSRILIHGLVESIDLLFLSVLLKATCNLVE